MTTLPGEPLPGRAYTRIRRAYDAICPHCLGGGYVATKSGSVACPDCRGTGCVEKWFTEIVHDE